eukprot:COSAG01_NODE_38170_length_493_cov_1.048223_1_plen_111_part_10
MQSSGRDKYYGAEAVRLPRQAKAFRAVAFHTPESSEDDLADHPTGRTAQPDLALQVGLGAPQRAGVALISHRDELSLRPAVGRRVQRRRGLADVHRCRRKALAYANGSEGR